MACTASGRKTAKDKMDCSPHPLGGALRVAFADFSAAPWQGFEKSECCPNNSSLYSPFCRYATSSPDRGKSLLAGGGQLSCNSRTGQIKNPPSECSGSNHIRHSYRMGLATTTTAASGRCREELLGQRPARRTCRPRHARMLGAATRSIKKEPTGLFFNASGCMKQLPH